MYWLYLENSKLTTSDQSVLIQVFYIKKTTNMNTLDTLLMKVYKANSSRNIMIFIHW